MTTLSEIRLDYSELSEPAKEEIYLAFMTAIMRHMKKPDVQERYQEWQQLRKEASTEGAPVMA